MPTPLCHDVFSCAATLAVAECLLLRCATVLPLQRAPPCARKDNIYHARFAACARMPAMPRVHHVVYASAIPLIRHVAAPTMFHAGHVAAFRAYAAAADAAAVFASRALDYWQKECRLTCHYIVFAPPACRYYAMPTLSFRCQDDIFCR